MVARRDKIDTPKKWQPLVADAISSPAELFAALDLPKAQLPGAEQAATLFALKFPRRLLDRIEHNQPDDPVLRQFLPLAEESQSHPGYQVDPLAEAEAQVAPGLLHKYSGRVLLITTAACAVHCRYCFRRHFPYAEQRGEQDDWQAALTYIENHSDIHEVILSGGDPLSLSDNRLGRLISRLESIPHLQTLRLHSRTAALFPERLTDELTELLTDSRLRTVLVLHVNHPDELDEPSRQALETLSAGGVQLLNQSVLLAGVNDTSDTLIRLSQTLFDARTLPYYLHLPDPVTGTAHFQVDRQRGEQIIKEMRSQLPGYLVPRLVVETAHEPGKTVIA